MYEGASQLLAGFAQRQLTVNKKINLPADSASVSAPLLQPKSLLSPALLHPRAPPGSGAAPKRGPLRCSMRSRPGRFPSRVPSSRSSPASTSSSLNAPAASLSLTPAPALAMPPRAFAAAASDNAIRAAPPPPRVAMRTRRPPRRLLLRCGDVVIDAVAALRPRCAHVRKRRMSKRQKNKWLDKTKHTLRGRDPQARSARRGVRRRRRC